MFKGIEKYSFKRTPLETPVATPVTYPIKVELEKIPELKDFKLWNFNKTKSFNIFSFIIFNFKNYINYKKNIF